MSLTYLIPRNIHRELDKMKRQRSMFLMEGKKKKNTKKLNKVDINNLFKRVQDNNYKDWIGMVQHIEKLENIRKNQIELKNKITELNTHTHTLE